MIIYKSNAKQFSEEVDGNRIVENIERQYERVLGRRAGQGEQRAWNNSMQFMGTIVRRSSVPDDCGILIEYNIPSTSKRIDFVITGQDEAARSNFVIVELKQWDSSEATNKEDLVRTYVGGGVREVAHPAYQAYSYKRKDMK